MSIFRSPDYTSDFGLFLLDLKAKKPTLEAEQRAGRAIWWDKDLNRSDLANYAESRVAQKPYVYGTSPHPNGSDTSKG